MIKILWFLLLQCSQGSGDEEGDESGPATGSQNENPGANPKSSANSKTGKSCFLSVL